MLIIGFLIDYIGKFTSKQILSKGRQTHDLCLQWFEFNHHALGSTCSNLFNMLLLFTVEAAWVSLTILEVTNSYEVDARHGSWPSSGFSRVLRKDEINAGHQYTMAVKMMNVNGSGGVNESGHPGPRDAINETNFDFDFFKLVTTGF